MIDNTISLHDYLVNYYKLHESGDKYSVTTNAGCKEWLEKKVHDMRMQDVFDKQNYSTDYEKKYKIALLIFDHMFHYPEKDIVKRLLTYNRQLLHEFYKKEKENNE